MRSELKIKMERVKLVYCSVLVLVLKLGLVWCQSFQSPCPGIFDYISDGNEIYGRIVLRPETPVSQLVVQVNFTVTVRLFSDYYGRLELENERFALQNYNRGQPMKYRVHFPVTSPLPRITYLSVNGQPICAGPGDVLRPNQYLTTFSLQHTSYIQVGGQSFFQTQPPQLNNFVGDYGDNPQVFFEGFDNDNNVNVVRPPVSRPNRPVYQETSRPSSPFFGNQNTDERWQRPPVNRPPHRPVTQPTEPVYVEPVTQPSRPLTPEPEEIFYYPPDSETEAPRPVVTPRPVVQQTPSTLNSECGVLDSKIPLIVHGTPYARGDVPWLGAIFRNIQNDISFICGGSLVSAKHVITAAHCMHRKSVRVPKEQLIVKFGVHDLSAWTDDLIVTRRVIDAKIYESYNPSTLEDDILILILKRVEFNQYIKPVCLWSGDTNLQMIVGWNGTVAGWGEQYAGGPKEGIPQMVQLPIVSNETCRSSNEAFHKLTSSHTLCAGDRNGAGPCKGDSGGGLYIQYGGRWRIRGIVSLSLRDAEGMCNLNQYLVFTDTAQFLPWIKQILQEGNE